MAGLTVGGLGSGLDINSIVQQLVAAEGLNTSNRLDRKEASVQSELSGLGFLKTAISDFQSALSGLSNLSSFTSVSAKSSAPTVFNVSTSSEAVQGVYSLEVQNVATSHKVTSEAFATKDTVIGTGTITFEYGTASGPFVLNTDKTSQTVDLAGTDGSLTAIRDAVNDADIDVIATIINDGSGYKLVFTSKDTGAENSLRVTTDDDDTTDTNTSGLSKLAYDPDAGVGTGKNMTQTVAALDATFVLDGVTMNSASNSLTDTIEGVTINLLKSDLGNTHTLTISETTNVGRSEIDTFIDAYNEFNATIRTITKYDPDTNTKGILYGDTTARSVLIRAANALAENVPELNSDFNSLAAIGLETGEDGTLSLNTTLFDQATQADPDIVARLLSNYGKTTDSNVSFVSAGDNTSAGNYAINITTIATRGDAVASAAANLTITDGVNDTVQFTIDGTVVTIDITAGTYTAASLAAAVQTKINSNANAQTNGVSVSVTESGGVLTIKSNAYGSNSSVTVDSGNGATDLMGAVPVSTTGVDVAGTIGGVTATGEGQYLTTGDGLKIKVEGTTTGSRGNINYTVGQAVSLDAYFESILETGGVIKTREESLNDQLEDIAEDREALFKRLERLEISLTAQFAALDQLLTGYQSTGNFLTGALASLPGAKSVSSGS